MTSVYRPNPSRLAALDRATDAGLRAGAQLVRADVRLRYKALNQGYIHGKYAHRATGVAASVTVGDPHAHNGNRRILIGTNKKSPEGFSYPLAWELGFAPAPGVFSPGVGRGRPGPTQFRRVEIWRPALLENRDKIAQAFARTAARLAGTVTPTDGGPNG